MTPQDFFIAVGLAYGSLAILLVLADRPRLTSPMGMLAGAYGSISVGVFLQAFTAQLPFWLHAMVGNLLAFLGLLYQGWAIRGMADRQAPTRLRLMVLAAMVAVVGLLALLPPQAAFASANLMYGGLFAFSAVGLITWSGAPKLLRGVTAAVMLVTSALCVARAVRFALGPLPPVFDRSPDGEWSTQVMYAMIFASLVSGAFSLLLLSRLAVESRLHDASEQLARLAAYDDLTGLPNRRSLLERGRLEASRAERSGRPLSVAAIDLDRLKLMNDSHGHAAGDQALQRVAVACHSTFRDVDHAARVGGDEFAVLLPDSNLDQAKAALERMLVNLRAIDLVVDGDAIPLSASVGVAERLPGEAIDAVYTRADRAMYIAKRSGGDAVVTGHPLNVADVDPVSTDTSQPPP